MLFVLYCEDKPDSESVRLGARSDHLAFIKTYGDQVKLGGPLLSDNGEQMLGSLIIIDVANRAAAQTFVDNDPYGVAGLFANVTVRPFRQTVPAP